MSPSGAATGGMRDSSLNSAMAVRARLSNRAPSPRAASASSAPAWYGGNSVRSFPGSAPASSSRSAAWVSSSRSASAKLPSGSGMKRRPVRSQSRTAPRSTVCSSDSKRASSSNQPLFAVATRTFGRSFLRMRIRGALARKRSHSDGRLASPELQNATAASPVAS